MRRELVTMPAESATFRIGFCIGMIVGIVFGIVVADLVITVIL